MAIVFLCGRGARIRADHPLRSIRGVVNEALEALSTRFAALYGPAFDPAGDAAAGDAFAGVLLDPVRAPVDGRLEFDLLFRWFVGLSADEPAWIDLLEEPRSLLDGEIAAKFLAAVLAQPRVKRLLSDRHFSVDGTLIERGPP